MKTQLLNRINTLIITILLLTATSSLYSQEKRKIIEISSSSFIEDFKLRYKFGNEKRLFRINYSFIGANKKDHDGSNYDTNTFNAGFGVGVEFPKNLNDQLEFYYGTELGASVNTGKATINHTIHNYNFSLKGVVGFAYHFNKTLRLGGELTPGIFYDHSETDGNSGNSYGFSIQNSLAEIVLGFSF